MSRYFDSDIYKIYQGSLPAILNLHAVHARQWSTILTVVFASTIAGSGYYLDNPPAFATTLFLGGIIGIMLSFIAVRICDRFYGLFLDYVSVGAKLEGPLGLEMRPALLEGEQRRFSEDEMLIPERWAGLSASKHFESSLDWKSWSMKRGVNLWTRRFFYIARVVFIIIVLAGIVMLWKPEICEALSRCNPQSEAPANNQIQPTQKPRG